MVDLRALQAVQARATVRWEGQEVGIVHRHPTEAMDREIFGGGAGFWTAENVRKLVVATVQEWDITDDGAPYPITLDSLQALPGELVIAIWRTVRGLDDDPKPTPAP